MHVDPAALDTLATRMGDLSQQAAEATAFLEKYLSIGMDEGRIFLTVASAVADVRTLLVDNTDQIGRLIAASAEEIARAADHYRTRDSINAANLEQAY